MCPPVIFRYGIQNKKLTKDGKIRNTLLVIRIKSKSLLVVLKYEGQRRPKREECMSVWGTVPYLTYLDYGIERFGIFLHVETGRQ